MFKTLSLIHIFLTLTHLSAMEVKSKDQISENNQIKVDSLEINKSLNEKVHNIFLRIFHERGITKEEAEQLSIMIKKNLDMRQQDQEVSEYASLIVHLIGIVCLKHDKLVDYYETLAKAFGNLILEIAQIKLIPNEKLNKFFADDFDNKLLSLTKNSAFNDNFNYIVENNEIYFDGDEDLNNFMQKISNEILIYLLELQFDLIFKKHFNNEQVDSQFIQPFKESLAYILNLSLCCNRFNNLKIMAINILKKIFNRNLAAYLLSQGDQNQDLIYILCCSGF